MKPFEIQNPFLRPMLSTNHTQDRSNMKTRRPILALVLFCAAVQFFGKASLQAADANPPKQLTYQGFLTDGSGVPLGNTAPANHVVVFRIYNAETGGTIRWSEQQTVTLDKGHFSVLLGEGSPVGSEPNSPDLTGYFAGADASDRFMEITVDGATINPRLQFQPAPYAMLSHAARQLVDDGGNAVLTAASGDLTAAGKITATSFSGNGANLTGIKNSAISGSAAIADSKLATITTSGKVANSATTATPNNTGSTIVRRNGSGNFSAGTITASGLQAGTVSATSITTTGNVTVNSPGKLSGFGTIPLGGIIMWSGTHAAIPNGWALCDGSTDNGHTTPNLRDRFVIGSGGAYSPKTTGGSSTVTLTKNNIPAHDHKFDDHFFSSNTPDGALWGTGSGRTFVSAGVHGADGSDNSNNYIYYKERTTEKEGNGTAVTLPKPPFYALAFIMRTK
jgi:hypothetical protein